MGGGGGGIFCALTSYYRFQFNCILLPNSAIFTWRCKKSLTEVKNLRVAFVVGISNISLPYRLGDMRQIKSQNATAKLVRFNILAKIPKNILFCIELT